MTYPDPRYFDYAASCPPYEEALEAFSSVSKLYFANPGSGHNLGKKAYSKLLFLKREFCNLVNYPDGRLLLCSSGTEANNLIIEGHMRKFPSGRLLIAEDAHDCMWYAREKYKESSEVLNIGQYGKLDINEFKHKLQKDISLVCINHIGNELGTIHPVREIADICSSVNVKLLIDGVQALGHIPLILSQIPCDYYSFSAHKFGGPRSTGGVFFRDDDFESLTSGGKQEWGLRAGTENLPGLEGSLVALKIRSQNLEEEAENLLRFKNEIIDRVGKKIPNLLINSPEDGFPGIISMSIREKKSHEIIAGLSLSGLSVSSGSACKNDELEPSRVILATGRKFEEAIGTIRISMGYGTNSESVKGLADELIKVVRN